MFELLVIRKSDNHQVIKVHDTEEGIQKDYKHYNKEFDPKKYIVTLKKIKK